MDFRVVELKGREELDTAEGKRFRQEIRDFLKKEFTDEVRREQEEMGFVPKPLLRELTRKLGAKGWLAPLAPGWPKEYGGQERTEEEVRILDEELGTRKIPWGDYGFQGPVILRNGSEEMKREYLPKIARAEITFTLGYTEPNAGTDLASLQMRAIRDGDDYIINGQKMYNGGAEENDYHWLAVRTNVNVPKHKGISLILVDLKSPGITTRPLWEISGGKTAEVFYDNVRVPRKNLVGEENKGWDYVREALAVERQIITRRADAAVILGELIEYVKKAKLGGKLLAEKPLVRQALAGLAVYESVRRLFSYRTDWLTSKGTIPFVEASMGKVFGCDLDQRAMHVGTQILGLYGQLEPGSRWAPLQGKVEHLYLHTVYETFGGGSAELLRSLVATRGMGLPREPQLMVSKK